MAWFSTSSKPPNETAAPSTDGAYIAPDRSTRAKCYEARDRFFDCLEQNGIIDSIREKEKAGKACATEEKGMAMTCAASWVGVLRVDCLESVGARVVRSPLLKDKELGQTSYHGIGTDAS